MAIVHNGVIENFRPLKERLETQGYRFRSATDSEVIAHLIASCLEKELAAERMSRWLAGNRRRNVAAIAPLVRAVRAPWRKLHGTYGLAIVFRDYPDVLIAARLGSPLVVGVGDGEHFVASDASPLVGHTDKIVYLADHELAVITADSICGSSHRDQGNRATGRPIARHCSRPTSALDGYPTTCSRRSSSSPRRSATRCAAG